MGYYLTFSSCLNAFVDSCATESNGALVIFSTIAQHTLTCLYFLRLFQSILDCFVKEAVVENLPQDHYY